MNLSEILSILALITLAVAIGGAANSLFNEKEPEPVQIETHQIQAELIEVESGKSYTDKFYIFEHDGYRYTYNRYHFLKEKVEE